MKDVVETFQKHFNKENYEIKRYGENTYVVIDTCAKQPCLLFKCREECVFETHDLSTMFFANHIKLKWWTEFLNDIEGRKE